MRSFHNSWCFFLLPKTSKRRRDSLFLFMKFYPAELCIWFTLNYRHCVYVCVCVFFHNFILMIHSNCGSLIGYNFHLLVQMTIMSFFEEKKKIIHSRHHSKTIWIIWKKIYVCVCVCEREYNWNREECLLPVLEY